MYAFWWNKRVLPNRRINDLKELNILVAMVIGISVGALNGAFLRKNFSYIKEKREKKLVNFLKINSLN